MAQQTAVEWLKDMLEWNYGDPQMLEISWVNLDDLFERAKQMEKEQIKMAYNDGAIHMVESKYEGMDNYYKLRYGSNNQI